MRPETAAERRFEFFANASATGKFWLCSMKQVPGVPLLDVTPELLESYLKPKPCQDGCGVYCVISESLASSHRGRYLTDRATEAVESVRMRLGLRSAPEKYTCRNRVSPT